MVNTNMNLPIYLDYNATSPVDPIVADTLSTTLTKIFGNPSSNHVYGQQAQAVLKHSREQISELIHCQAHDIIFTGCATEANNLCLQGIAYANKDKGRHIITSAIEHPSVIQPLEKLQEKGWDITILPVDNHGQVSPDDLKQSFRKTTILVSIMHANNETGSIQPIKALAAITKEHNILFHTDAAQSTGKIAINVDAWGIDLLTIAGHKFYASKGVGALFIRKGTHIEAIQTGGNQECALRPGTENIPAIAGLGMAAQLAQQNLAKENPRIQSLRDSLHQKLTAKIPQVELNGHPTERLPNTLNISFPNTSGRQLLQHCKNTLAASVGSACHEDSDQISGVLAAMGKNRVQAAGAIRLSIGRFTTEAEIQLAADTLILAWQHLTQT